MKVTPLRLQLLICFLLLMGSRSTEIKEDPPVVDITAPTAHEQKQATDKEAKSAAPIAIQLDELYRLQSTAKNLEGGKREFLGKVFSAEEWESMWKTRNALLHFQLRNQICPTLIELDKWVKAGDSRQWLEFFFDRSLKPVEISLKQFAVKLGEGVLQYTLDANGQVQSEGKYLKHASMLPEALEAELAKTLPTYLFRVDAMGVLPLSVYLRSADGKHTLRIQERLESSRVQICAKRLTQFFGSGEVQLIVESAPLLIQLSSPAANAPDQPIPFTEGLSPRQATRLRLIGPPGSRARIRAKLPEMEAGQKLILGSFKLPAVPMLSMSF